ncbi:hypothetical protein Tco_1254707 [Tanacetum coccineum]
MMNELVRNQCDVPNHQVNVQFLLQLQPEWQRFVTLIKQSQELKTVSYHKLYDILKQHQNEVNEIRAKSLARIANPLALVAQQQPIYHPQNHPTQNNQYSSNRSQQPTKNRGKTIVNSFAPIYDQEPVTIKLIGRMIVSDESDDQRNGTTICTWHNTRCYTISQLSILDPSLMRAISIRDQDDQDDIDELDQERDLLASLIEKLKCEIDDSKNSNKFLETSNKALVDKLKGEIEDFKKKNKSLESSNNHFKEANNELSKTNQFDFKEPKEVPI